jgi:hypothetical protein
LKWVKRHPSGAAPLSSFERQWDAAALQAAFHSMERNGKHLGLPTAERPERTHYPATSSYDKAKVFTHIIAPGTMVSRVLHYDRATGTNTGKACHRAGGKVSPELP